MKSSARVSGFLAPMFAALALAAGCDPNLQSVSDDGQVVADDATPPIAQPTPRPAIPRQPPITGELCTSPSVCPPAPPAPCNPSRMHCPNEPAPEPTCPAPELVIKIGDRCCTVQEFYGQKTPIWGTWQFSVNDDANLKCIP